MKYLLDVNVLLALGHTGHSHHAQAKTWFASVQKTAKGFHTCSIPELGFVRVAVATGLQPSIEAAREALTDLKAHPRASFELAADARGAAHLPAWAKKPAQVTNGHLLELAHHRGLKLVTFDKGIPGALCVD